MALDCDPFGCDERLRVIDVTAPSSPAELGSLDGVADTIEVSDGYAYMGCRGHGCGPGTGLHLVDISVPAEPTEAGAIEFAAAYAVAASDGYAYVLDFESLRVFDLSEPSAPVEVGFLEWEPGSGGEPIGVAVSGAYAFIAGIDSLRVIDVSTPSSPFEVGFIELDALGVAVSGSYAYVTGAGLEVVDISNPTAPVTVGSVAYDPALGFFQEVAVSNSAVFLAAGYAGVYVFDECLRSPSPNVQACLVPAAAVAAGAEGAFFQTDLELNNAAAEEAQVALQWLPRGENNSEPMESEPFTLAPGASLRFENVLTEVFGLEPDSLGALKLVASTDSVIGMSRTYNVPSGEAAGTFGQGLAGIADDRMIPTGVTRRILFLSEDDDIRSNVGCVNGAGSEVTVAIDLYDSDGAKLETKYLVVPPFSNRQINGIFGVHAPIDGYADFRTDTPDALIYCYGSVLDNVTSDPTTVPPQ